MATYVITLIGDDRVGIVEALADAIRRHGGNWERSELAELGGKFAGIVMFSVAGADADSLITALREAAGGLDIAVHETAGAAADAGDSDVRFSLELVGNDRPGIVSEITAVLRSHGISIDRMDTAVTDAPMAGGHLFQARADLRGPSLALAAAQAQLEALAAELMVDLSLT